MRRFYIGRFQPYHDGHHKMVEAIASEIDELVLGIGSAGDSHSPHNPFTAGERIMMITKSLVDLDLVTYTVPSATAGEDSTELAQLPVSNAHSSVPGSIGVPPLSAPLIVFDDSAILDKTGLPDGGPEPGLTSQFPRNRGTEQLVLSLSLTPCIRDEAG